MSNRKNVSAFSSYLYRYRNLVERFFHKIKHYRAVAMRYDKTPDGIMHLTKCDWPRIPPFRRVRDRQTSNLEAAGSNPAVPAIWDKKSPGRNLYYLARIST
jgi:hypothetical protein